MLNSRRIAVVLSLVFLLSGISGLGCQMIWTRMLGMGLGHEAAALLAVVTAFFGGLAAGAWRLGRAASASARPGRWYAGLELAIAGWVLASAFVLPTAIPLAQGWLGQSPSPWEHWLVVFGVTFVVLLPATAAMGGTLPAIERFTVALTGDTRSVGRLYAANTFGAVAGTFLGAFALIPALGFRRSLIALATMNLLSASAAFLLERLGSRADKAIVPAPSPERAAEPARGGPPAITFRRYAWTAFGTGLLGIGFEILGIRLLSQVLENTIYSYAAVLGIFLVGTAAGAVAEQRLWPGIAGPARLRRLWCGLAFATALGMWVLWKAPHLSAFVRGFWGDGVTGVLRTELTLAAAVFLLPTLLMGASFSALAQAARAQRGGVSGLVALNALGAATAPVLFGVLALPCLGSRWALTVVAAAYLLFGIRGRRFDAWLVAALILCVAPLPGQLRLIDLAPAEEVVEYREGITDTVLVVRTPDGQRALRVNNRFSMGGTAAANAERRHAHVPLLLHPHPQRALLLGTGTGITFGAAVHHPELQADGVELVPEVAAVMPQFAPENEQARWGPRLTLHLADARRFVRSTTNTYDVIVADLFHPARDGAGALYTREHFAAVRARLAPGGLFCQWLPLHQLDDTTLRIMVRTFLSVFPDARAFLLRLNVDTPVVGLFGATEKRRYPANWLGERVTDAGLRDALQKLALTDTLPLLGLEVAGPAALARFAAGAALNTDDRPVVMFTAPRLAFAPNAAPDARLVSLLGLHGGDPAELLAAPAGGEGFAERLQNYWSARDAYLAGLRWERDGRHEAARQQYLESVRLSPDFSTGYAHCLTLAAQQSRDDPVGARRLLQQLSELQPQREAAQELLRRLPPP